MQHHDFTTPSGYTDECATDKFNSDAYVENDVVRWKSNDRVPPKDFRKHWADLGLLSAEQMDLTNAAEKVDNDAFFAAYAEARANRTPEEIAEERYEARAAHGAGVELVNMITGERWTT